MKRFLLLPLLLILTTCDLCHAGYSIYVAPQIPEFYQANGPNGPENLPTVETPVYPNTFGREICRPDNYSPFVADLARRTLVFEDITGTATSSDLFAACPQIRAAKEREIRSGGSTRLSALANPYSAEERETWAQQQDEAREYATNSACDCSMIRNMAADRGIPLDFMAAKILENATLFKAVSGSILGKQQRLLDRITVETDFATLLAIGWGQ